MLCCCAYLCVVSHRAVLCCVVVCLCCVCCVVLRCVVMVLLCVVLCCVASLCCAVLCCASLKTYSCGAVDRVHRSAQLSESAQLLFCSGQPFRRSRLLCAMADAGDASHGTAAGNAGDYAQRCRKIIEHMRRPVWRSTVHVFCSAQLLL